MAAPAQKTAKKESRQHYTITGNKAQPKNSSCPKCGPGNWMANHASRTTCGKCGYTEYKKK